MIKKVGNVITSHVTKAGTPIRYKIVAIANGHKTYGLGYNPSKGSVIVKRLLKDGTLSGKNRIWAMN